MNVDMADVDVDVDANADVVAVVFLDARRAQVRPDRGVVHEHDSDYDSVHVDDHVRDQVQVRQSDRDFAIREDS